MSDRLQVLENGERLDRFDRYCRIATFTFTDALLASKSLIFFCGFHSHRYANEGGDCNLLYHLIF